MSVGQPYQFWLNQFGSLIWDAFGEDSYVFHVGSSVEKKEGWRDVDVRVLLSNEEWKKWGFLEPNLIQHDPKYVALCLAFSELGHKMTGLPIDFQIQRLEDANKEFSGIRSALGITPLRTSPSWVKREKTKLSHERI